MDTGSSPASSLVAFVCLHGSAKSVIAAEYLNRAASERGLALHATAAGLEPDPAIPPHVVRGLAEKGWDVAGRVPASARAADLGKAARVIAFGCPMEGLTRVEQWADCPAVSDGFEPAWRYIVRRVDQLLAETVAK
jgi:protein-tyrosine-phosphatase